MLVSLPEIRFSLTVPKFTQASDWKFSPKIVRLKGPDPGQPASRAKRVVRANDWNASNRSRGNNELYFVRVASARRRIRHHDAVGAAARDAHRVKQ
jgi:hypothetical protein